LGQYWLVANLSKKEFLNPHELGTGLKLWEQLANHPGTGAALIILCAAMPEPRGGGDFSLGDPEINDANIYAPIAQRTIGRWAGDRIALVGDYAQNSDLPVRFHAKSIYNKCNAEDGWKDITGDVCAVIEHELRGHYSGDGWRKFEYD
jgi:hypothetical protein